MNQYVGIADCHGLESFILWTNLNAVSLLNKNRDAVGLLYNLELRAIANRQRHSVVYRAEIDRKDAKIIDRLFNKGEFKTALIELKNRAKVIEIGKGHNMKNSWNLIPNDILDPYWSK